MTGKDENLQNFSDEKANIHIFRMMRNIMFIFNSFKKLGNFIIKNKFFVIAFLIFFAARIYVLNNPPYIKGDDTTYSDVSHDYERYANMWWYGLPPYLKHYYEYPPATIPLLLFPLWLDLKGTGVYYANYRVQIFILEIFLFFIILKVVEKIETKKLSKYLAVGFYCIAGVIAKDFWYEGLDLVFIGSYTAALAFWLFNTKKKLFGKIISWFFFWLSTAIKFMSGPLFLPLLVLHLGRHIDRPLQRKKFRKNLAAFILGFLLVWGLPLVIFRSSLSVSLVFHLKRGAKYASFPSFIIETINQFTGTEVRLNEPPDFQFVGPASDVVLKFFSPIFFMGILLISFGSAFKIFKNKKKLQNIAAIIRFTLIYILFIFLTGKVFSAPFHIWLIPLITIFPFKNIKKQVLVMALTLYMLILDTTPWVRFPNINIIGPISLSLIGGFTRFIPMIIMLVWFLRWPTKNTKTA